MNGQAARNGKRVLTDSTKRSPYATETSPLSEIRRLSLVARQEELQVVI